MLFSRNWLGEYVELPEIDDLAAGLTAVGLAVEGVTDRDGDAILDVEVTPNRTDCMNHLGLAREVAVKFGQKLNTPKISGADSENSGKSGTGVTVSIADFADCPRYTAVAVDGVQVGPSPPWLVERLESIGLRSINNIVDVTNFVLWECGQPLHAFDLETFTSTEIGVRRARSGEILTTLDGVERRLSAEILVIADGERAIALAGIMGGAETEVTDRTTAILLESAHFAPSVVRRGANQLAMHTDASHRFERGTDPQACADAALRAAHLIAELAGGTVRPGVVDAYDSEQAWHSYADLDLAKLEKFGGVRVSPEQATGILEGLGYRVQQKDPGPWRVTVPSWRFYDREAFKVEGPEPEVWPADIYEEVLRVVGLDQIPATLPAVSQPDTKVDRGFAISGRLRRQLAGRGLVEAVSYSFESEQESGSFGSLFKSETAVEVRNPVSESFRWMRRSILPGLVEAARFNQRRSADAIELFELGRVFVADQSECDTLGVVVGGAVPTPWDNAQSWDFFALKGVVESVMAAGQGSDLRFESASLNGFCEGRCAVIVDRQGNKVGQIGEIEDTDLAFPLFAVELAVEAIGEPTAVAVRPPSRHPEVTADITLTHGDLLPWSEIERVVQACRAPELVEFGLKDRYQGEGVPDGATNTTIWFRYNSDQRSLTQDEVNSFQQVTSHKLREELGWPAAKANN